MSDDRLRELERRAASGSPLDVVALHAERIRIGAPVPGSGMDLDVSGARRAAEEGREGL
jgi:hypothetical protein